MTDDTRRKPSQDKPSSNGPVTEIVEKLWQGVLDTLESLVLPQPVPIPIPIRDPRRR